MSAGTMADGVWPTMITLFTDERSIDYAALDALVERYVSKVVSELFAVCQSSEMFHLSLAERVDLS